MLQIPLCITNVLIVSFQPVTARLSRICQMCVLLLETATPTSTSEQNKIFNESVYLPLDYLVTSGEAIWFPT